MQDSDIVLFEVSEGVALLTLNRPERLNAWNVALEARYFDLLRQSAADPDVRVIVVTGAGRGFCSGLDMQALQEAGGEAGKKPVYQSPSTPLSIPKPIIAAINGSVAGLGLVQALMCDMRFAAAGAKITTAFARRGLVAEQGISWLLPRLIGHAAAFDLLFSARVLLAEEAAQMGLVNKVLPAEELLDYALAYARDIAANCSPASLATIKSQVYGHLQADFEAALAESGRLVTAAVAAPDFREGVAAFMERRAPRFAPLPAREP